MADFIVVPLARMLKVNEAGLSQYPEMVGEGRLFHCVFFWHLTFHFHDTQARMVQQHPEQAHARRRSNGMVEAHNRACPFFLARIHPLAHRALHIHQSRSLSVASPSFHAIHTPMISKNKEILILILSHFPLSAKNRNYRTCYDAAPCLALDSARMLSICQDRINRRALDTIDVLPASAGQRDAG